MTNSSMAMPFITPKILMFGAFIICILVLLLVRTEKKTSTKTEIKVGDTPIQVEVMRTPEQLAQGLSGKQKLEENEGMLFIMPTTEIPTFWMKDMLFPLDMIWIKDATVVDVTEQIPAPKPGESLADLLRYSPKEPANRVLEVNAGFSQKHDIKKGSTITIPSL